MLCLERMELVVEANDDDAEAEEGGNLAMLVKSHLDLEGDAHQTVSFPPCSVVLIIRLQINFVAGSSSKVFLSI